jgi:hypothetical protein
MLINRLANMHSTDRIKKMNNGGLSSINPNTNWLRLKFVIPLKTSVKPNLKYLNHVLYNRFFGKGDAKILPYYD